jgi:hypothetical protein
MCVEENGNLDLKKTRFLKQFACDTNENLKSHFFFHLLLTTMFDIIFDVQNANKD